MVNQYSNSFFRQLPCLPVPAILYAFCRSPTALDKLHIHGRGDDNALISVRIGNCENIHLRGYRLVLLA